MYTLRYRIPGLPGLRVKRTRQETLDQAIQQLPRGAVLFSTLRSPGVKSTV
jgi:hypothetical protein